MGRYTILAQVVLRFALTVWLLVLVYRGSRVALVIILALICLANEAQVALYNKLRAVVVLLAKCEVKS